jgi:hypothetical protein
MLKNGMTMKTILVSAPCRIVMLPFAPTSSEGLDSKIVPWKGQIRDSKNTRIRDEWFMLSSKFYRSLGSQFGVRYLFRENSLRISSTNAKVKC